MEDDVKNRFDNVEGQLDLYEKRLSDFRWYITGFAGLLGIIFSVISIALNWNFSNERASVREFMNEARRELGIRGSPPNIILLAPNKQPIEGQEIPARVEMTDEGPTVRFDYICQNTGEMSSGNIAVKYYTNDPLPLAGLSSDEAGFKYESSPQESDIDPKEFPGHFSLSVFAYQRLARKDAPPPGRHPFMFKRLCPNSLSNG